MADYYVDKASPGASAPYNSWATAADELDDAIAQFISDDADGTIYVRAGTYTTAVSRSYGPAGNRTITIESEYPTDDTLRPVLPAISLTNTSTNSILFYITGCTGGGSITLTDSTGTNPRNYTEPRFTNFDFLDGEFLTLSNTAKFLMTRVLFKNADYGIRCTNLGEPGASFTKTENCIFYNCTIGILFPSAATTEGTFTDTAFIDCGTGIKADASSAPGTVTVRNPGFFGNTTDYDANGTGTTFTVSNAVTDDPEFIDPDGDDFNLPIGSPYLDAGYGGDNIGIYQGDGIPPYPGIAVAAYYQSISNLVFRD